MVQAQSISVRKGATTIVQQASLDIPLGQLTVALGRNGAGKSTLLEALTGNNPTAGGQVSWDGVPQHQLSRRAMARKRAVLSQQVSINFPITVQQLAEMGTYAACDTLDDHALQHIVQQALSEVGATAWRHRAFNSLSGGEQKRVLLAKALIQLRSTQPTGDAPQYLFLDEPTASLDVEQQFELLELVKRLAQERGIGVFAILHDLNLAAQFADQVVLLQRGKVVFTGTPAAAFTPERLAAVFGIPAIVQPHPTCNCPYIITLSKSATALTS